METFGLIMEFVFLGLGIYLYLFSIGKVKLKKTGDVKKAEAHRASIGKWLKPLSLMLIAIMIVNVYLHIMQLI